MAEISLQDLMESQSGTSTVTPPPAMVRRSGQKKFVEVSREDIAKTLPNEGKPIEEKGKTPKVIQESLNSMVETIARKKGMADALYEQAEREAEYRMENGIDPTPEEIAEAERLTKEEQEAKARLSERYGDTIVPINAIRDDEPIPEIKPAVIEKVEVESIEDIEPNNSPVENVTNTEDDEHDPLEDIDDIDEEPEHEDLDELYNDINDMIDEMDDTGDESMTVDDDSNDEDDVEVEETTEETRERFKKSLEGLRITKDIDLSSFKISAKPVNSSVALRNLNDTTAKKRADWPLLHTGINVTFVECSGPEIDTLSRTVRQSNNVNAVIQSLRFVYNHIDAGSKPSSFEEWTKIIRTEDIESLYFGMYYATYGRTNYLGRQCPAKEDGGCGKTAIYNEDIMKMLKYDDEAKEQFEKLSKMDTSFRDTRKMPNIIPVSENIAIAYTDPTLYNTFIQFSTIPQDVLDKYTDTINSMAYIEDFFLIDRENQTLTKIKLPIVANNINKTVLHKLKFYINLLKNLSADQYSVFSTKMNTLVQNPKVTYVYPETTCSECGHTIPEEAVDSCLNLLFTRAQLAQIKAL